MTTIIYLLMALLALAVFLKAIRIPRWHVALLAAFFIALQSWVFYTGGRDLNFEYMTWILFDIGVMAELWRSLGEKR